MGKRITGPSAGMYPTTFLRVSPGYAVIAAGEKVRFTAVELDHKGQVVSSNIAVRLKTKDKDGIMQPDGILL